MKLKFDGINVGSVIRAYDFEPLGDRPDRYIDGEIVEVVDGVKDLTDAKMYRVRVEVDTLYPENPRPEVFVPMEVLGRSEWDGRVTVLGVAGDLWGWR